MRRKPRGIVLLLLSLFAACALIFCISRDGTKPSFWVELECAGKVEQIKCWEKEPGEYYVFLPSYAELEDARLVGPTHSDAALCGEAINGGLVLKGFALNSPLRLECGEGREKFEGMLTLIQSGGVPAMYIDTDSGSMKYIHAENGNSESGRLRLYSPDGGMEICEALDSIGGRGNYTWEMSDKKPYSLSFAGEVDLLSMGAAERWILLSNAEDLSHMRNKIVYELARDAGLGYAPQSEWVDLYLNGEYAGLYLLCERNEIHPERVDIREDGSFLVSTGRKDRLDLKKRSYFSTESGQNLRIHHPRAASAEFQSALQARWQTIENALLNKAGTDPLSGKSYLEMIDLDSWARKYLIEEISCNLDACYISQYYYACGLDEPVYAGPVWDYDLSMGNPASWQTMNPCSFIANRAESENGTQTPWFHALYAQPVFYKQICELYQVDFLPALEKLMLEDMEAYISEIEAAASADYIRWGAETTLEEQAGIISEFLEARIDFLSDVWLEGGEYCQVSMVQEFGGFSSCASVVRGESMNFLPDFEDADGMRFLGWYYADSGEPVDPEKPVYEDISICGRWERISAVPVDKIVKMLPLGIIAVMFVMIFFIDIRRTKPRR